MAGVDLQPLADSADYQRLIGKAKAGVDLDALLAAASDEIRRSCGWIIGPTQQQAFRLDGPGGRLLMIPTLRLVSVDSAAVNGQPVDLTDLAWSTNGYVDRRAGWGDRYGSVSITVTHGWDDVPAGLRRLCCTLAGRAMDAPVAVSSEQVGSVSMTYRDGLMAPEQSYLAMYRIPAGP